jgi:fused signal recognition particle receptor
LLKILSFFARKKLDEATAGELSDILVTADIAPGIADEIIRKLKASDDARRALREELLKYAVKLSIPGQKTGIPKSPASILVVGVNGAGKTTTIGKLAKQWNDAGRRVLIGACDTFRAAADGQLDAWAKRAGAEVIHGAEPAAVAYKTIEANADIAVLDTAGRLHNRDDLMQELAKIVRVIKKIDDSAPTEAWLVLDGTTGQNALTQIEYFNKTVPLTGLIATKMDGTSKGGFLITYAAREKNPLPVKYIGYGEKIDDLKPFDAEEYVDKLMG